MMMMPFICSCIHRGPRALSYPSDPGPGLLYDLPDGKNSVYPECGDPQQCEVEWVNSKGALIPA